MAGYQFLHVEAYAREESTKQRTQTKKNANGTFSSKEVSKGKRGNVRWIMGEAGREEDSCYHIENPQPPIILLGDLEEVEQEANEWAENSKDAQGRKLRKDAHCLLAGVISLPRSEEKQWDKFKAKSIEWLKEKYKDNLQCVIEHQDEAHPHLHFYVIPKKGQSFDDIHEGKRAQKEIKKQNPQATKQEQNIAFAEAMRATQDDFSKKVGQPFGLTRLGPGRRRLTRKAWQAEQAQAKALKDVEKTAKQRHEHYKKQGLEAGKKQAQEEAQAIGFKVGAVFDGVKTKWHAPSAKVLAEAEKVKEQAKTYADRTQQHAERLVQDERRQRRTMERELEKKTNIATNLDTENKRLKTQLADTEADRQRLLKQLKSSGGGGTGGVKPK